MLAASQHLLICCFMKGARPLLPASRSLRWQPFELLLGVDLKFVSLKMVLWICQWICCARRSSWSRVFTVFVIWGPGSARMGAFAIFSRFLGPPSGRAIWCMGLSSPACVWAARKATCVPRRHTGNNKHHDDSLQPSISQPSRGINLIRLQKPFW